MDRQAGGGDRREPVLASRCLIDGKPVLDLEPHLRKHLGHKMKPCYPAWWERLLLTWGWRP